MPEEHLDVYLDHSVLHSGTSAVVFAEGKQSEAALDRYSAITKAFEDGFYLNAIRDVTAVIASNALLESQKETIKSLVDSMTSEVGRGLIGLSCLQLAIKSIAPLQSIRLHKGANRSSGFSWQEGISMRTLDNTFNAPFLRQHGLLNINKDGVMMTRSLAENYPYSRLYKAELRGPVNQWIDIVESLENNSLPPYPALCYLLSLLQNRSIMFAKAVDTLTTIIGRYSNCSLQHITKLLTVFFTNATYSARAFEVVIHCFLQAFSELGLIDGTLVPLSQMRSANKKHGNVGDVEIKQNNLIVESWDAKFGIPYLRDELEELHDKLENHPSVKTAGFITNCPVAKSSDIIDRANELSLMHDCQIMLLSFDDWINMMTSGLKKGALTKVATHWLVAVVESFGQKRPGLAPIDEPCDAWVAELTKILAP